MMVLVVDAAVAGVVIVAVVVVFVVTAAAVTVAAAVVTTAAVVAAAGAVVAYVFHQGTCLNFIPIEAWCRSGHQAVGHGRRPLPDGWFCGINRTEDLTCTAVDR